ncbi:MAG: hypothetical protein HC767_10615 [Akkermansiaceae bacterium]|nr:hypothetical protein [Akkermansiaceae bacterium]
MVRRKFYTNLNSSSPIHFRKAINNKKDFRLFTELGCCNPEGRVVSGPPIFKFPLSDF